MKKVVENVLWMVGGAVLGGLATYAVIELTKPVVARVGAGARLWEVGGARWGPYMRRITAGRVPTRPGLGLAVEDGHIMVGPYAGGVVAPKFIPSVLTPKYMHGA